MGAQNGCIGAKNGRIGAQKVCMGLREGHFRSYEGQWVPQWAQVIYHEPKSVGLEQANNNTRGSHGAQ